MGLKYHGSMQWGRTADQVGEQYLFPKGVTQRDMGPHMMNFLKKETTGRRYTVSLYTTPRRQYIQNYIDNYAYTVEKIKSQTMGCYSPLSNMASMVNRNWKNNQRPLLNCFALFHRVEPGADPQYNTHTRYMEIFYDYVMSFDNQYRRWIEKTRGMFNINTGQAKHLFVHVGLIIPGEDFWNMPKNYLYGLSIVYRNMWDSDLSEFKIKTIRHLHAALRAAKVGVWMDYPWNGRARSEGLYAGAGQHDGINVQQPFKVFDNFLKTGQPYHIDFRNSNWGSWASGTSWSNGTYDVFKMMGPFSEETAGNGRYREFMQQFLPKIDFDVDKFNDDIEKISGQHSRAENRANKAGKEVRQQLFKLWSTVKGDRVCVD